MAILLVGPLQDVCLPSASQCSCRTVILAHPSPEPRPHHPTSNAPFPSWAPLLALVASTKCEAAQPAERSSDAQGCGKGFPERRCPAEWLLEETSDCTGSVGCRTFWQATRWRAAAGFGRRGLASERTRGDVQVMVIAATHGGPGLRSAPLLRAGMQRLQQTRTKAVTRMRYQSCDF
jgi:hypothetical protein